MKTNKYWVVKNTETGRLMKIDSKEKLEQMLKENFVLYGEGEEYENK